MGPVPKFKHGDKVRCTKEGDFRKGTVIHDYHRSVGPYYLLVSDRGIVWSEHAMHLELTETNTPDLLPCPFCGGKAIDIYMQEIPFGIMNKPMPWWHLKCLCGHGADFPSKDGLIEKWNTRVAPPSPEFIAALSTAKMDSKHDHLNALMDAPAVDAGELVEWANELSDFLYRIAQWGNQDGLEAECLGQGLPKLRAHLESVRGRG